MPDVYRYDDVPPQLRAQVVHIMDDTIEKIGNYTALPFVSKIYDGAAATLCHEYGHLDLDAFLPPAHPPHHRLIRFLMDGAQTEEILDIIELCFTAMVGAPSACRAALPPYEMVLSRGDRAQANWFSADRLAKSAEDAVAKGIEELNQRFLEHNVGYRFESGQIIRIDSQMIHSEVVSPALTLLAGDGYAGAQEEFLRGHKHYRKGNLKEAMNAWATAFESVMRRICDERGWKYDGATARTLIGVCLDHDLIPAFWQDHFTSLRNLLQVGVARNKLSAHGQGAEPVEVPRHLAAFVLHMTAAAILFLAEAEASGAGK